MHTHLRIVQQRIAYIHTYYLTAIHFSRIATVYTCRLIACGWQWEYSLSPTHTGSSMERDRQSVFSMYPSSALPMVTNCLLWRQMGDNESVIPQYKATARKVTCFWSNLGTRLSLWRSLLSLGQCVTLILKRWCFHGNRQGAINKCSAVCADLIMILGFPRADCGGF